MSFAEFARENVSIRNVGSILKSLADHAGIHEIDTLTEIVRQGLSRHVCFVKAR